MRIVYPEGTENLLDLCQRHGAERVWHTLANGSLQAFHWRMDTGEFRQIDRSEWARIPTAIEPGGAVVKRHPVEFIEQCDLSFIGAHEVAGKRIRNGIGDDPVLIDEYEGQELFEPAPPAEKGRGKSAGRPSIQAGLRTDYQKRFPNGHEREGLSWREACLAIGAHENQIDTLKRSLGIKK